MLTVLVLILLLLWVLGYVQIGGVTLPHLTLFSLNDVEITLWTILTLIVLGWIIGILPTPFRQIASIFLILWVLAVLGVVPIAGLPSLLLITIIVGLLVYLFGGIIS